MPQHQRKDRRECPECGDRTVSTEVVDVGRTMRVPQQIRKCHNYRCNYSETVP